MPRELQKRSSPSSCLEIRLLGPFRVIVDGSAVGEAGWPRRKPKLLVKLLALEPHHRPHRDQLMGMLWPDLHSDAAANKPPKTIPMARDALEPGLECGRE